MSLWIDGSHALIRDEDAIEDAADRAPRRRCRWCPAYAADGAR